MNTDFEPRMMRMNQVTAYCAMSRAYIYQLIKEGRFPEGHLISPGIRAWERADVDNWLDQQKKEYSQ